MRAGQCAHVEWPDQTSVIEPEGLVWLFCSSGAKGPDCTLAMSSSNQPSPTTAAATAPLQNLYTLYDWDHARISIACHFNGWFEQHCERKSNSVLAVTDPSLAG